MFSSVQSSTSSWSRFWPHGGVATIAGGVAGLHVLHRPVIIITNMGVVTITGGCVPLLLRSEVRQGCVWWWCDILSCHVNNSCFGPDTTWVCHSSYWWLWNNEVCYNTYIPTGTQCITPTVSTKGKLGYKFIKTKCMNTIKWGSAIYSDEATILLKVEQMNIVLQLTCCSNNIN